MSQNKRQATTAPNIEIKQEDVTFDEDLAALQNADSSEGIQNSNTLFIRGIPFTATDEQFETFFQDIGPLKRAFIVKDKENKQINRGFGFVSYALRADAEKAITELSTKEFEGRKLKMEFANEKTNEAEAKPSKKAKQIKVYNNPKPKDDQVESDRTMFISNIPKSMGKARLVKFLQDNSIKPVSTYFVTGYARALYETVELAQLACSKLQNKMADNKIIHATILTNLLLKTKKCRLIIRNLAFKIQERELEKIFEKIGPVIETKIPKDDKNKLKGFAFVQYPELVMAEEAIEKLNGTEHSGRKIAIDFCVSKASFNDDDDDEEVKEEEEEVEIKVKQEEEEEEIDGEIKQENQDNDDGKPFKSSMFEEEEEEEDLLESSEEEDSSIESSEEEEEKEEEDEEKTNNKKDKEPKKIVVPPECTLFIRNLLFETKDEDLFGKFSEFGKLRYARVVFDRDTGRSKGTGFVSFINPKDAINCLKLSKTLNWEHEHANNTKGIKSVLVSDAPNENNEKFTLQGRLLLVTSAVTKDSAAELTNEKKNPKVDKRNYYLLREGVIFPQSDAGKKLEEKEIKRRQESYKARKDQMQSNPSLFISKTRLAVRNLPLEIDDRKLKTIAHSAVDKFKAQVQKKLRDPLSKDEMKEGWDKKPMVTQAKIVRSKDRVDAKTNLARSKGYGFVEFTHHAHALAALRYLNCNPAVFPEKSKLAKGKKHEETIRGHLLMVEFAIENKVILKRRTDRNNDNKKRKFVHDKEEKENKQNKFKKGKEEDKDKKKVFVNKKRQKKKMIRRK
ncbi:RNA-binding domain-containing protein [Neoconidiobolus thromboides FSU 785]|nr:RNA-binding domain-containing protein [Neoconidiobolus thromboides FSU 785]